MNFLLLVFAAIGFIAKIEGVPSIEDVKAVWSRYTKISDGDSRYYGEFPTSTKLACQLSPVPPINSAPGWIKVAASREDFLKSVGCGMCIEITGDGTPISPAHVGTPVKGKLKAVIVDICGGCKQAGFDLYIPGAGVYKTKFKAIECPSLSGPNGNIKFRFRGSNPWYLKLQVRNTKVVAAGLEILKDNKWICMKRGGNNHFIVSGLGEINFPIKVRVTSISNEQLETTIDKLENDVDIPSKIQFSGFTADASPEDIKCYGQGGVTQDAKATSGRIPPTNKPDEETTTASTSAPSTESGTPGSTTTTSPSSQTPTTPPASSSSQPESTTQKPDVTTSKPDVTTSKPDVTTPIPPVTPTTSPGGKPTTSSKFCIGKGNGHYPDKLKSTGFIICANERTFRMNCPKGLLYNEEIQVCDWPRNVKKPSSS